MKRVDLIAFETFIAATYRREASSRRLQNPMLAAQLVTWAEASDRRVVAMRSGPLFAKAEDAEPEPAAPAHKPLGLYAPNDPAEGAEPAGAPALATDEVETPAFLKRLAGAA